MLDSAAFVARLNHALASGERTIPVLLLRLPEFAEFAWRDGKRSAQRIERATTRAFSAAASRVVRDRDLLAHDVGSDWFCVAMLTPARGAGSYATIDARTALERICATMSLETGRRMESGWSIVEGPLAETTFAHVREQALERGARERERYEFLATVGHELRTPLTSIRGYIETLLDDDIDPQTSRRFLETARREALRLTRLVEGILDFSMLDLRAPDKSSECDLTSVARAAIEALVPIARDAGVKLEGEFDGPVRARIDADACMHVLLNVVENGIKYGGRPGIVRVHFERQDPFVALFVDDNGDGVAESDAERIFSYGERVQATSQAAGRGVGLSIVRTIVERAGGAVRVEPSALGGARFCIDFVLAKAEPVPVPS